MSIILKGIDKSKYTRTFQIYPSGVVMEIIDGKIDNENPYQAIQIPTPHGRMIDGDELKANYTEDDDVYTPWLRKDIDNAPTILEAEE